MVVSRQLDSVLVEQNHCQGLTTVKANCTKLSFWSPLHYAQKHTTVQVLRDPSPYTRFANFQV